MMRAYMEIRNAVVLITSAGSQVGGTLAHHFASLGATLVICDQESDGFSSIYEQCLKISNNVFKFTITDNSLDSIQSFPNHVSSQFR